jgi:hypothetical protein
MTPKLDIPPRRDRPLRSQRSHLDGDLGKFLRSQCLESWIVQCRAHGGSHDSLWEGVLWADRTDAASKTSLSLQSDKYRLSTLELASWRHVVQEALQIFSGEQLRAQRVPR